MANNVRGVRSPAPAGSYLGRPAGTGLGNVTFQPLPNSWHNVPQAGARMFTNGDVISLATTGVTAGTYDGATTDFTINAEGQVTGTSATGKTPVTGTITVDLTGDTTGSGTGSGDNPTITITTDTVSVNGNTFPAHGGYTSGGVLYASATTAVTSSADWTIASNALLGNVSGGTPPATRSGILQTAAAAGNNAITADAQAGFGGIDLRRTDGTFASPTAVQSGEVLGQITGLGYDGSIYTGVAANIQFIAAQTWTSAAHGGAIQFAVTADGATGAPSVRMILENDGGLSVGTAGSAGTGTVNAASAYFRAGTNIQTGKAATNKTTASPGAVTTSAPLEMLGFAGTITPTWNGQIVLSFTGSITDATLADVVTLQLSYGTGGAPSNGGALAGTQVGAVYKTEVYVASNNLGFCLTAVVTGLSAGTAYWLDLAVGSSGGHAVTFGSTNCAAWEI